MKNDIAWHEMCAQNSGRSLQRDRKRLESEVISLNKRLMGLKFYEAQIALAVKEKKNGFDREKFGMNRIHIDSDEIELDSICKLSSKV